MTKPYSMFLGVLSLGLAACPGDDTGVSDTSGEDSTSTTGGPTTVTVTVTATTGQDTSTSTDPTMGLDSSSGTTSDDTTSSDSSTTAEETSTGEACTDPEQDCGGVCVDTTMSDLHCGMCDRPCMMGDACSMSLCSGSRQLVSNGDFAAGTTDWSSANNPDQVATCMTIPDDETIVFADAGGYISNEPGSMGPSSHVFYQDFMVPMGSTAATFSIDYAQEPTEMLDPANVQTIVKDCLDENMDGLQQNAFRIDLVDPAEDVFLAPILFEVATPDSAAGSVVGPMLTNLMNTDPALLAFLQGQEGTMLRLRIAQVESTAPWPIAFDNVSLMVDVSY